MTFGFLQPIRDRKSAVLLLKQQLQIGNTDQYILVLKILISLDDLAFALLAQYARFDILFIAVNTRVYILRRYFST